MSSHAKGESLADTIRVVESYCDAIVLRHPMEGAARLAAEAAHVPVINGGDGSNQHPTQTFLDLYTIRKATGRLDGLHVGFIGDLRYGRTVHSLATALLHFDVRDAVRRARRACASRDDLRDDARARRAGSAREVETARGRGRARRALRDAHPEGALPRPRRLRAGEARATGSTARRSSASAPDLKILHPLPRVNEVDPDVDAHPGALYFEQAKNGVTVRMALLSLILWRDGAGVAGRAEPARLPPPRRHGRRPPARRHAPRARSRCSASRARARSPSA